MTRPEFLDGFDPRVERVATAVRTERMSMCKSCEKFRTTTKTCSECNCFMPIKTTLATAGCPLGKW